MKATFLDFRRNSKRIIEALRRNERVTVMYRGKPAAVMHPVGDKSSESGLASHPAIGIWADRDDLADVDQFVRGLRQGRGHGH